ncbi:hypothetical protein [Massilia endophytica]|uniref:hypothetical protein n=1 Tax=Massilia endophytica TaxID=2899220 RepID=UPI001E58827B|nr:hypothetical protein [Massilia endophytica]UGQ44650.1 hypothetical protein LSQ66_12635 [Massilia endophytica]
MRQLVIAAGVAVLFLTACDKAPPKPPKPIAVIEQPAADKPAVSLSASGIGGVVFGMGLKEAERALNENAQPLGPVNAECSTVRFASMPRVRFMVEKGIITRADAERGVPNIIGVDIDSPVDQVRRKFPNVQVTPHKYLHNGHYLTIAGDGNTAFVLEDNSRRILKLRAGMQPSVSYVEGCL